MSNDQSPPTLSVEFFPPKDISGEERLWQVLAQLAPLKPDFVSVTYGAGGSTRDRTIRVTTEITARTSIPTVAHLTCVGSTKSELSNVLDQYKKAGIESILALRGDPPSGPRSNWQSIPGGFDHADQLVELAIESKDLKVGVAAFPDGHPSSNFDLDKEELGASFATTQFFFDVNKWQQLVERLRKRGSKLPIIAGILPITNLKQLNRMVELSGMQIPEQILTRFKDHSEDVNVVREIGIDIATEMGSKLLEMNVPGIHFYTMNSADSTIKIARNLGLVKR